MLCSIARLISGSALDRWLKRNSRMDLIFKLYLSTDWNNRVTLPSSARRVSMNCSKSRQPLCNFLPRSFANPRLVRRSRCSHPTPSTGRGPAATSSRYKSFVASGHSSQSSARMSSEVQSVDLAARFTSSRSTLVPLVGGAIAFSRASMSGGKPPDQFHICCSTPVVTSQTPARARASLRSGSAMTPICTGFGSNMFQKSLVAVSAVRMSSRTLRRLPVTNVKLRVEAISRS
jgi:hypothetical protein